MTISSTTARNDYTAIAAQTIFPYTFKILTSSELAVYVDGVLKTETTDYTVSGATNSSGGNVTFLVAMTGGESVSIVDVPTLTQLTHYIQNDAFSASTHENALDKLTRISLYLRGLLNKTLMLPLYSSVSSLTFAEPVANYFLRWNAAGTAIVNYDIASLPAYPVSAFGATLIDDAAATNALTTLGVTPFMKTMLDDDAATNALTTLGVSPFMKTMLDDTDATVARATMGLTYATSADIVTGTAVKVVTADQAHTSLMKISGSNLAIGSDADGDMYYRASSVLARLAKGTANLKLFMNAGATAPEWSGGLKIGTFTRNLADGSGNVSYTTIGFKPSVIILFGGTTGIHGSWGWYDGTSSWGIAQWADGTLNEVASCAYFRNGSDTQAAVGASMDADGFTLTWTKANTPTGTGSMGYIAFR